MNASLRATGRTLVLGVLWLALIIGAVDYTDITTPKQPFYTIAIINDLPNQPLFGLYIIF